MIKKYLVDSKIKISLALNKIDKGGEKSVVVVDENKKYLGTLSDGDIRRALIKGYSLKDKIQNIYNKKSYTQQSKEISKSKITNIFKRRKYDLIPVLKNNFVQNIFFRSSLNKIILKKKIEVKKINNPLVIMAGGKGSRLFPLTNVLPKPLLSINGKPIILHIINNFFKNGINKFIISINKENELLKNYLKKFSKKYNISFIEESKPLGTVGPLSLLKKIKKPIFVTNCDVLFNTNINNVLKTYNQKNTSMVIVTVNVNNNLSYGVCDIEKDKKIKKIIEKPKIKYNIVGGLYLLNPKILKYIPKNKHYSMDELIKKLLKLDHNIYSYSINQKDWNDIGQFASYKKTIKKLSEK